MEPKQAGFGKSRAVWTALAAGMLAASTGCAAPTLARNEAATFTVHFRERSDEKGKADAKPCPASVDMEKDRRNCGWLGTSWLFPAHDCIKVKKGSAGTIRFVPEGADRAMGWEVRFHPFAQGKDLVSRDGAPAAFTLDPDAPKMKYAFSVTSGGCPELDPVIIVW
ncbi:MAG TPA: hypothetical protein VIW03_10855 [Anaeromyxobacter sp.]